MFPDHLLQRAETLIATCRQASIMLATAESCTGGLLAALLTEIAGSSQAFERGFVTYSNAAKADMLGVPWNLIAQHGAVSAPVAIRMAEGALCHSPTAIAVSITGIAGPGGGSFEKPVGLVHFACARAGAPTRAEAHLFGDRGRSGIRLGSVERALRLLEEAVAARPSA
jgi:nicotinamide-nucleotide amidase